MMFFYRFLTVTGMAITTEIRNLTSKSYDELYFIVFNNEDYQVSFRQFVDFDKIMNALTDVNFAEINDLVMLNRE